MLKGGQLLKRSFLSLTVAALVLCLTQARAQDAISTVTPGGVAPSEQPAPSQADGSTSSGVRNPGIITLPAPSTGITVGGETVLVPNSDCLQKVAQALANRAVVPVSDPRCADAMNRALELQETRPEPGAEGNTPELNDYRAR